MTATFSVSAANNGFYQFHLVDGKGEPLLISPEYESKELLEQAIQDVRVGSLMSQFIAKGKTPEGEMSFVIKDKTGSVIAKSMLFDNEMNFDNALHKVKDNACIAEITYSEAISPQ